jgi:hypothetical protein
MYSFTNVVYGLRVTPEAAKLIMEWWDLNPQDFILKPEWNDWPQKEEGFLDGTIITVGYDGSSSEPYDTAYCGVYLESVNPWEVHELVKWATYKPTKQEIEEANKMIKKLPHSLREVMGEVGIQFVREDS